jgi:hypothetical protein
MVVQEPIEPIGGHFFKASNMGHSATGCLTVSSFLRSFRRVGERDASADNTAAHPHAGASERR